MDIGKAMLEIREAVGISRKDMAEKLGIRPQSVWKIEKNKSVPKLSTIEKFCHVTNIPLAYLLLRSITREDYTTK